MNGRTRRGGGCRIQSERVTYRTQHHLSAALSQEPVQSSTQQEPRADRSHTVLESCLSPSSLPPERRNSNNNSGSSTCNRVQTSSVIPLSLSSPRGGQDKKTEDKRTEERRSEAKRRG